MNNIANYMTKNANDPVDNKIIKKLQDSLFESVKIAQQSKSSDVRIEKILREVEKGIDELRRKLIF